MSFLPLIGCFLLFLTSCGGQPQSHSELKDNEKNDVTHNVENNVTNSHDDARIEQIKILKVRKYKLVKEKQRTFEELLREKFLATPSAISEAETRYKISACILSEFERLQSHL